MIKNLFTAALLAGAAATAFAQTAGSIKPPPEAASAIERKAKKPKKTKATKPMASASAGMP